MAESPHPATLPLSTALASNPAREAQPARANASVPVAALVEQHYDFVWRTLRFLGIDDASAEDGAQEAMCVFARRIDEIAPGAERSFLFTTAMRVAATLRRTIRRRPESGDTDVDALEASMPNPEELLDEREAHGLLRKILDALPVELRLVFVLHEVEEMTLPEIAEALGIPLGTATSRLRRGREQFQSIVDRLQAALRTSGEPR